MFGGPSRANVQISFTAPGITVNNTYPMGQCEPFAGGSACRLCRLYGETAAFSDNARHMAFLLITVGDSALPPRPGWIPCSRWGDPRDYIAA